MSSASPPPLQGRHRTSAATLELPYIGGNSLPYSAITAADRRYRVGGIWPTLSYRVGRTERDVHSARRPPVGPPQGAPQRARRPPKRPCSPGKTSSDAAPLNNRFVFTYPVPEPGPWPGLLIYPPTTSQPVPRHAGLRGHSAKIICVAAAPSCSPILLTL